MPIETCRGAIAALRRDRAAAPWAAGAWTTTATIAGSNSAVTARLVLRFRRSDG
jgi:hypothetical protein